MRCASYLVPVFLCVFLLCGCAGKDVLSQQSPHELCKMISNEGIKWDGCYFGIYPSLVGEAEKEVMQRGLECKEELVEALADESRYVAAHVLLANIVLGLPEIFPMPDCEWHGLRVIPLADGSGCIDKSQQQAIQKVWQDK